MALTVLAVEDLRVRIQRIPILRGISLEVSAGRIVGLVGRNGAGKTTTLRAVMGLIRAEGGRIRFDGHDLLAERPHTRSALGIGYMPEDRRLVPQLTVEENLLVPLWANQVEDPGSRLERTYERIPLVADFRRRPASLLSGGQQKLVALARALVIGRRLLLLDEPFEGLAPALADTMAEAIRRARDEDQLGILVVESERRLIERVAEDTLTIERGEILPPAGGAGPAHQPDGRGGP